MKNIIWSTGHELILNDIVKARNCELFDSGGNKYIDMESGVWCTSIGHCNPRINSVMVSQLKKITHTGFNYCNPALEAAARNVLEITGFPGGKCEFLCSGSEAVEYCIRAAKAIKPGAMVLTFSDSYFGAYGEAARQDRNEWYRYNRHECTCHTGGEGCRGKDSPGGGSRGEVTCCEGCSDEGSCSEESHVEGCSGECIEFSKIPFDKIGIFLFEPGSSSGLVKFPSAKLIGNISEKIRENNGLILINEVTTGAGRTGKWFGFQHYDLKPDMIAMGKGIGNGYPVSVAALSARAAELLEKHHFHYSQSHQNDPLGASIVTEVIGTINDEKLVERSRLLGEKLKNGLERMKMPGSILKEIRGRGLMIALEFTRDAGQIQKELIKRGFIVAKRSGHEVLRIDPALTIREKDIDEFMFNLNEIITHLNTH
jgi:acetylornithine aminotransferase